MHHLTLRQLEYFKEIVAAGNMTRAATKLHVAPTALSLQVRAMEDHLGVGLLERHSRGVQPTAAGTELYQSARRILDMVDEAERTIAANGSLGPRTVRLGVISNAVRIIGIEAVLAGGPGAKGIAVYLVEGTSSSLVARLEQHDLDFALVYQTPSSSSLNAVPLLDDMFLFATCSGDAREGGRVTLAEALRSDLVFFSESDIGWNAVHAAARRAGLSVRAAHKVGSIDVIRHMVARGLATVILPFGLIEEEVRRKEIAVHEIEDVPIVQRLNLVWPKDPDWGNDLNLVRDFVFGAVARLHARCRPYSRLVSGAAPHGTYLRAS